MNPHEILRRFPHASKALLAANAHDYGTGLPHENNSRPEVSNAKPERDQAPTLGEAVQGEVEGIQRTRIRFTGYRVRPLDPDNFAGSVKDLLDGLRHALLIGGDEPWRIRLETEQVKVATFAEEKTVIELTDLPA